MNQALSRFIEVLFSNMKLRHLIHPFFCLGILMALAISAQGQRGGQLSGLDGVRNEADTTGGFSNRGDDFFNNVINEDTLNAKYYSLKNIFNAQYLDDTTLHRYTYHYDRSRMFLADYATLGNVGSAAFPLIYEQTHREGLDIGLHQYDLWKYSDNDRLFYDLEKSFTHLFYSQSNQENHVFKAAFARSFEDNFGIAINYDRINQVGIYQRQNIDHSNLHLGLRYTSTNRRYQMHLSLLSKGHAANENGGITTDTLFGNPNFTEAAAIPVVLDVFSTADAAEIRHQERSLMVHQTYVLARDSADLTKPQITLSNAFSIDRNFYRYGDVINPGDSAFYRNLAVNPQGLRMSIHDDAISNHFKLLFAKVRNPFDTITTNTFIETGLKVAAHQLSDEVRDSTVFDMMLTGGGEVYLGDKVRLFTDNHLIILGDNIGSYKFEGMFSFDLGKAGVLKANLLNQNYTPSLIHRSAPISNQYVWTTDFSNINELTLGASYHLQSLKAEIGFGYHLLNNFVYVDQNLTPQQLGSEINVLQLSAQKDFTFGKIHLNNYAVYQTTGSPFLPLPELFSKHSLYYQGLIFKQKLELRAGIEARLVSGYDGYEYRPLIGQFVPGSLEGEGLAPVSQVDFFLAFDVGNMRAFAKMEHLEDIWNVDKNFFVHRHPLYNLTFRFGLSWYLIN